MELLIKHGADVNGTSIVGSTALMRAAYEQKYYSSKFLIEHGAIVNKKFKNGYTALMFSVMTPDGVDTGNLSTIKLLIDINIVGNDGHTALTLSTKMNKPWVHTFLTTGKITHPKIGVDAPNDIGDPTALYQKPLSKQFVQNAQYRQVPLDLVELQPHLNLNPKPHVVYACPVGHLHSADNCGIPMELKVCSNDCPFLTGGVHHFLAPGNYIVYHDNNDSAKVWYGNFPVYDYPSYELLVEQYNMAAILSDLPTIISDPEKGFTNIAREEDIKVEDRTECSICKLPVEDGKTYVFPECGHFICEECLTVVI